MNTKDLLFANKDKCDESTFLTLNPFTMQLRQSPQASKSSFSALESGSELQNPLSLSKNFSSSIFGTTNLNKQAALDFDNNFKARRDDQNMRLETDGDDKSTYLLNRKIKHFEISHENSGSILSESVSIKASSAFLNRD